LLETTPEFDSIVNTNPYVKKSFEEQSIAGMKYDFIYDNSTRSSNGTYLQLSLASSGNLIDLIKSHTSDNERPYTILGNIYSQFFKATLDTRYYTRSTKKGLAMRLYAGTGISYGNSVVMPYIEQYYCGGSNSIRAFVARSLGPGGYQPEESNGIIDQTGDIRIEGNLEYRFEISKTLLGAFFVDAGNVWLLNPDEYRPDAEFKFNTFMKQLAVGTGAGLRFDFDFFVLRTDFGIPLRTPYPGETGNWIKSVDDNRFGLMLNLAIGYPF
jgi:outer membrane translocation and assembly module TamA